MQSPKLSSLRNSILALLLIAAGNPVFSQTNASGFDVLEYAIEGNSRLSFDEIAEAVMPFMGPDRKLDDVIAAAAALEKVYRDKGYLTVSVDVPEQKISGGVINLRVQEGRVGKLTIRGARYYSPGEIRAALPEVAEGSIPNFPEFQKQLAALTQTAPDRSITPTLKAGGKPGTTDIDLLVDDKAPLHGSLDVSNRQSADTHIGRVAAAISYDNLWQLGHSLGFSYFVSPKAPGEVNVLTTTYAIPRADGERWTLAQTHSNSRVNNPEAGQSLGKGNTEALHWNKRYPATEGFAQSIGLSLERKDQAQASGTGENKLRYQLFGAQYQANWTSAIELTSLDTSLNLSPAGLNSRKGRCGEDQFACVRNKASADFLTLRPNFNYERRFKGDWQLFGGVQAQLASGPLASYEQFSAGGLDTVRGYLESERAGDSGAALRFEARAPAWNLGWLGELRAHVFYDYARLWLISPLPEQDARFQLASTGLGMKLEHGKNVRVTLDAARAIHRGERTQDGAQRIDALVHMDF